MVSRTRRPTTRWTALHKLSIIIRLALVIPSTRFLETARDHSDQVQDHDILHNGTYSPAIPTGEKLAAKWGTIAGIWNIAICLPHFILLPPLHLPLVIVDTIITVHLAFATHLQDTFVPHDKKLCSTMSRIVNQRPKGTNESFFAAAARLNGTMTPPEMCGNFVEEWQYGISISVCYAFISFIGIVTFVGSIHRARKQNQSLADMLKDALTPIQIFLIAIPIVVTEFLRGLIYLLPVCLFRCFLPMCIKGPVRAGRRYTVKAGLGAGQKAGTVLEELRTESSSKNNMVERYQGTEGQSTPLAQFLGIYDMLMLVSEHLHYVDLMNLSSVSRSVRQAVLPPNDLHRRIDIFRLYTCQLESKKSCWTCPKQTCSGCHQLPLIPQVDEFHHLECCVPYCKSCHYKHNVCGGRGFKPIRLSTPECRCAPNPAKASNIYQRFVSAGKSRTRTERNLQRLQRPVCRDCNKLTAEELVEKKTKATKVMLKRGVNCDGNKWKICARSDCGKSLGVGPRFWVCSLPDCKKECVSYLHKAWSGRRKGEGDDVIGEVV